MRKSLRYFGPAVLLATSAAPALAAQSAAAATAGSSILVAGLWAGFMAGYAAIVVGVIRSLEAGDAASLQRTETASAALPRAA